MEAILKALAEFTENPTYLAIVMVLIGGSLAVNIYLINLLRGSLFSKIPFYMLLITVVFFIHKLAYFTLEDNAFEWVFAVTALAISSLTLLLFYSIRFALKEMIGKSRGAATDNKEAA